MSKAFLWALITGFLLGVFLRSHVLLGLFAVAFLWLLSLSFFLLSVRSEERPRHFLVIGFFALAVGCGVVRMNGAVLLRDPALLARLGSETTIRGVVYEEPDIRENTVRLFVRTESLESETGNIPASGGVLVLAPLHTEVAYGDIVSATGYLRLPERFDTSSGRSFNYPEYLAKDGIGYELAFAQVIKEGIGKKNVLKSLSIFIKQKYLEGLRRVLSEPQAGLAGGITAGDKRSIGNELSEVFRTTGLVHIVVLSGYNISIVIDGLSRIFSAVPRFLQFGGSIGVVFFFIFISGGASSAIRAGSMALLAVFARTTGRVFLSLRILGVVSAVMVVWNPYILAFDPWFQLSILATAGLITITPKLIPRLTWLTPKWGIREIAASTLGAQIAVLPLLLYQNGQLPVYSLFANMLALVAIPYAMAFSAIAAVAGIAIGGFAVPFALPAYTLLSYVIFIGEFFASLPFASLSVPAFNAAVLFTIYIFLFGFVAYKTVSKKRAAG